MPFCGWIIFHHILFMRSPADGHFGCSSFLANMNNAVVNICSGVWLTLCFVECMLSGRMLIWMTFPVSPLRDCPTLPSPIPPAVSEDSYLPTSSPRLTWYHAAPESPGSNLWHLWDFPGPRIKPVSPALAGGFLTTKPPRKSKWKVLKVPGILTLIRPSASLSIPKWNSQII